MSPKRGLGWPVGCQLLVEIGLVVTTFMIASSVSANPAEKKTKNESFTYVQVHKCCERNELMLDLRCVHKNESDTALWSPMFTSPDGKPNVQVPGFNLVTGTPDCGARQPWHVYEVKDSTDRLYLLPNGVLRHYIYHQDQDDDEEPTEHNSPRFYDYNPGTYCLDKGVLQGGTVETQFAVVCNPEIVSDWKNTDFLMRRIVNPVFHVVSMICLLAIAVVYFVLPQLRDLVGNIVMTVAICLIVGQAADLVGIFTEYSSHVSFLVADVFMYVSLLAAFFWLNSLGYYIWKTFRSRNVFLRVTDGRKYCYYSGCAWSATATMAGVALFAHFVLDVTPGARTPEKDAVGWLGVALFFTPVAFSILVDVFFYATTARAIGRMTTYGRIHHKMKYNFELFLKLFLVMTVAWLFLLLSRLNVAGLFYAHVVVNALQGPLVLYVCVIGQRRVTFLLRKACCYEGCPSACCRPGDPTEGVEWGEEMMVMNTAHY